MTPEEARLRQENLRLRIERDEALEAKRQLEYDLTAGLRPRFASWPRGVKLTRTEWIMAECMYLATGPVAPVIFRRYVDTILGRTEAGDPKSLAPAMSALRRKLARLDPPIAIRNAFGVGHYFDDEAKARYGALRPNDPENSHEHA